MPSTRIILLQVSLGLLSLGSMGFSATIVAFIANFLESFSAPGDMQVTLQGILVASGLMLAVSFMGLITSFFRSNRSLFIFIMLSAVLVILQVVAGGVSISISNNQRSIVAMSRQLWTNWSDEQKNQYQNMLRCCGYNDASDASVNRDLCVKHQVFGGCGTFIEGQFQHNLNINGQFFLYATIFVVLGGIVASVLVIGNTKEVETKLISDESNIVPNAPVMTDKFSEKPLNGVKVASVENI